MKIIVLSLGVALFVGLHVGCAQMSASWEIGSENQRYRDRVLANGSDDFREYLRLQKATVPRWNKSFDEHGEPDYIIPGLGQDCKMVWIAENLTASPTAFGYVDFQSGIPAEIKEFEERKKIAQQNSRDRMLRQAEEALKQNAELTYLQSIKGLATNGARYRVEKLDYKNSAKSGVLTLIVEDADFVAARLWAKFYIEMMARDKNVAIVTGKRSEDGRYLMKNEKVVEGKKLIIEFETL